MSILTVSSSLTELIYIDACVHTFVLTVEMKNDPTLHDSLDILMVFEIVIPLNCGAGLWRHRARDKRAGEQTHRLVQQLLLAQPPAGHREPRGCQDREEQSPGLREHNASHVDKAAGQPRQEIR